MEIYLTKIEVDGKDLILIGRDNEMKRRIYKVVDFYPYFYTKTPKKYYNNKDIIKIEDKGYKSINGEKLWKIIVKHPGLVPKLRDENSYEADIPYDLRFLIDMNIKEYFFIKPEYVNNYEISKEYIKGDECGN